MNLVIWPKACLGFYLSEIDAPAEKNLTSFLQQKHEHLCSDAGSTGFRLKLAKRFSGHIIGSL